jgi:transcriptional regulator of acetoin/glycerol metabolism
MGFQEGSTVERLAVWERFISTGEIEPGTISPMVEASWRRCQEAGVDPFAGRANGVMAPAAYAALAKRKQTLIQVAKPFMENLFRLVSGTSFVVLLFDEQGYLLETVGSPDRIRQSRDLNLNKGALWSEAEVGTNGAGTALVLGRPFQVSGQEHFCRKHHRWTCSGAPIMDPAGNTIGVLDMSGPVNETHLHTLGLVMAAVEAIQHEFVLARKNQELTLLNNRLSSIILTVTDGVIVLDTQGRLCQINPVAERMLAVTSRQALGQSVGQVLQEGAALRALLDHGREFLDVELDLKSSRGNVHCLASGKPILDEEGASQGAVLFVNPLNKIKGLVNRFSGAQAAFRFEDILGDGPALVRAIQLGRQASGNDSNILLTGESGTGKEMFAQSIHNHSDRRNGPFVAVNCGAIPRDLIASELFGFQEGAFTGAARGGRPGKFELASSGTLFLDEIGDMPLEQQIALLRVLQDQSITRIGGDRPFKVDVRIICATHRDLREEIRKGLFRQDLYYRLYVTTIPLPSLREHPEDIPVLFASFTHKFTARKGMPDLLVAPGVIPALQAYPWPGNIREFQNVVERMIHSAQGDTLDLNQIPEEILNVAGAFPDRPAAGLPEPAPAAGRKLRELLQEEERSEILACLRTCKGNMSKAAQELGMARNTLYRKMQKLEI